jgi:hypothetical protein
MVVILVVEVGVEVLQVAQQVLVLGVMVELVVVGSVL